MNQECVNFIYGDECKLINHINLFPLKYDWTSVEHKSNFVVNQKVYTSLKDFLLNFSHGNYEYKLKLGLWCKFNQDKSLFNALVMSGSHPLIGDDEKISLYLMKLREIFYNNI